MRQGLERHPMKSACAAIFILFLWGSVSAGEERSANRSAIHRQSGKEVRLQLRISEAKKNKDSLRYYKSLVRQQLSGEFKRPASACGMTDGSAKRSY